MAQEKEIILNRSDDMMTSEYEAFGSQAAISRNSAQNTQILTFGKFLHSKAAIREREREKKNEKWNLTASDAHTEHLDASSDRRLIKFRGWEILFNRGEQMIADFYFDFNKKVGWLSDRTEEVRAVTARDSHHSGC